MATCNNSPAQGIIPLVDLPMAQQVLNISDHQDLEDLIIVLQRLLQATAPLEAPLKPALVSFLWNSEQKHFALQGKASPIEIAASVVAA